MEDSQSQSLAIIEIPDGYLRQLALMMRGCRETRLFKKNIKVSTMIEIEISSPTSSIN
jgi:hypothetical protein